MLRALLKLVFALCSTFLLLGPLNASADSPPKGFSLHYRNEGRNPVTKNGETTYTIKDKQCSNVDYGDGRGESDCKNGNVASIMVFGKEARMGQSLSYKFDLWVQPDLRYEGFRNNMSYAYLDDGMDSRLRIASWEGEYLHNFIYMLKVDSRHGVSFLANVCQKPSDFGTWVSFEMKVRWSNDTSGWIDVLCNGQSIYSAKNVATNQNPHCYIQNQCEPDKKKNPKKMLFVLGPVMAGFGGEWKKYGYPYPFTDIQPEGLTFKTRNEAVTQIKN